VNSQHLSLDRSHTVFCNSYNCHLLAPAQVREEEVKGFTMPAPPSIFFSFDLNETELGLTGRNYQQRGRIQEYFPLKMFPLSILFWVFSPPGRTRLEPGDLLFVEEGPIWLACSWKNFQEIVSFLLKLNKSWSFPLSHSCSREGGRWENIPCSQKAEWNKC
jgi:hypothetical protein